MSLTYNFPADINYYLLSYGGSFPIVTTPPSFQSATQAVRDTVAWAVQEQFMKVSNYVFTPGWGTDFVYDFENGLDKFDTKALGINFGALTVKNSGANAEVALASDPLTLFVVVNAAGQIDESDFLF